MKKKALSAAFISALLITALAGILLVRTGLANPYSTSSQPGFELPPPNPANIDIQRPQGNTSYIGSNVNLRVSVADLADIHRIFCYLDGRQITVSPLSFFTLCLTDLPEGPHTIKVSVSTQKIQEQTRHYYEFSKGYPNLVSESEIVCSAVVWSHSEVSFTVDNTSPQVSVLSPKEGTYGTEVLFDFVVDESTRYVVYSLDGRVNVTISCRQTLKGLSNGEHTATVYAWDKAGNVGASETITFTVALSEPEPFPTTLVIASIVVVAVVSGGLLV